MEDFISLTPQNALIPHSNSNHGASTALHYAALVGDVPQVLALLQQGYDINAVDKFGCTPLDLAITHHHTSAALLMINKGHLDNSGARALYLALDANEIAVAKAIIYHPEFEADAVAFRAFRWKQIGVLTFLIENDMQMPVTQTLMTAKMLAHRFSLDGKIIVYPEGFPPETAVSLNLEGHFGEITAREGYYSFRDYIEYLKNQPHLPQYFSVYTKALDALAFASQPGLTGKMCMDKLYESYLKEEPETIFVPTGWDGHAVGIVIRGDMLYKCNRGIGSDGEHGIVAYKIGNFSGFSEEFFDKIIAAQGSSYFFQREIDELLDLQEVGRFEATPQTVGNCAWFSAVESVHAILLTEFQAELDDPELAAMYAGEVYDAWGSFDLDHSILELPKDYSLPHQKEMIDDVLFKLVHTHHDSQNPDDLRHSIYVLQYVDEPELLLQELNDPDFHLTLSLLISKYIGTYEHSHWYDRVYFWVDSSLDTINLGFTDQTYDIYAQEVSFGKSLITLVNEHPTLLITDKPASETNDLLSWNDVFPEHTMFCLDARDNLAPASPVTVNTFFMPYDAGLVPFIEDYPVSI